MKCIKENLGFYEFGKECEKFENEILNTKGVAKVLISDLDEEIPYSGGIFRKRNKRKYYSTQRFTIY